MSGYLWGSPEHVAEFPEVEAEWKAALATADAALRRYFVEFRLKVKGSDRHVSFVTARHIDDGSGLCPEAAAVTEALTRNEALAASEWLRGRFPLADELRPVRCDVPRRTAPLGVFLGPPCGGERLDGPVLLTIYADYWRPIDLREFEVPA